METKTGGSSVDLASPGPIGGTTPDTVAGTTFTATPPANSTAYTAASATHTASAPVFNGAQTWNNGAVTFTGFKLNVTDTASATASLLMDLQTGGNPTVSLAKAGSSSTHKFYTATYSANTYLGIAGSNAGTISFNSNALGIHYQLIGDTTGAGGPASFRFGAGGLIGFNSANSLGSGALDVGLSRISAGLFGIGTGAAASFAGELKLKSITLMQGTGAGLSTAIGKASINTTAVGNVDAGTDDLMTYSLPLNSFSAAGKGVHITAWGATANNANAKTVTLNFGSTAILTNALTASIAGVWRIEADVFSTGTDAQTYISQLVTTGTAGVALNDLEQGTSTEDDGAAIVIKCTATATATDDISQKGLLITFLN